MIMNVNIKFTVKPEYADKLFQVEKLLREMGIEFDCGGSYANDGSLVRDWEWDWSLRGPVKVMCSCGRRC
jgi:hypothetical protein